MKRLNLFLVGLAALTMTMVFTSCEEESTSAPSVNFTNGKTEATTDKSPYTITGTITSEVGLKTVRLLKVTSAGEDQIELIEKFDDKNSYAFQFDVTVSEDMTVKVEATDKDNQKTSRNFVITYSGGALTSAGSKQLGAGGNQSLGSYYSVADNAVYKSADLDTKADKIDFVFDADGSKGSIFSPSLSSNTKVNSTGRVSYFEKSTIDFDAATVANVDGVDPSKTSVDIVVGDVVVYKTHDSAKGIFKVTELDTKDDGTVTISIKVKE
jgi:hypothetical protein